MRAKNRHGIHSKFVYDFLDKTLYRLSFKGFSPDQKLLKAAIIHFKPKNIGFSPSGKALHSWLIGADIKMDSVANPVSFYITGAPNMELEALISNADQWDPDAIIFVGNIRKNKAHFKIWQKLCALPKIRVSLETYDAGLLCFRPKQAPQHFKIRLNSSIFGKK